MQLKWLAGILCLAACLTTAASATAPGAASFTLRPIGNGVWAAIAAPQSIAGASAGFVDGSDSIAVVDAVPPGLTQKYGAWGFFKFFSRPDILHLAVELEGKKRVPTPAEK